MSSPIQCDDFTVLISSFLRAVILIQTWYWVIGEICLHGFDWEYRQYMRAQVCIQLDENISINRWISVGDVTNEQNW